MTFCTCDFITDRSIASYKKIFLSILVKDKLATPGVLYPITWPTLHSLRLNVLLKGFPVLIVRPKRFGLQSKVPADASDIFLSTMVPFSKWLFCKHYILTAVVMKLQTCAQLLIFLLILVTVIGGRPNPEFFFFLRQLR